MPSELRAQARPRLWLYLRRNSFLHAVYVESGALLHGLEGQRALVVFDPWLGCQVVLDDPLSSEAYFFTASADGLRTSLQRVHCRIRAVR
jgi:hypothetical protein